MGHVPFVGSHVRPAQHDGSGTLVRFSVDTSTAGWVETSQQAGLFSFGRFLVDTSTASRNIYLGSVLS
eukprot:2949059-Karenia_brevis.AAC.1